MNDDASRITDGPVAGDVMTGAGDGRLRVTMDSMLDPHVVFEAVRDGSGAIVDFRYVDANAAACAYNRLSRRDLLGARLLQRLPGVRPSGLFAAYCRVVETGEPLLLDGVTYESDLGDGDQPYYDIRGTRLGDGLALSWRDVTDRHRATEALRAQRDLAVALSATSDLAVALDLVMEAVLDLDEVDSGGIYLFDPETGGLDLAAHAGLSAEFVAGVGHFAADSPNARALMEGSSIFGSHPRLVPEGSAERDLGLGEGLRAFAAVPIRDDGLIVAAITMASHARAEFSGLQRTLIVALGAQVGGAIARLRREAGRPPGSRPRRQ